MPPGGSEPQHGNDGRSHQGQDSVNPPVVRDGRTPETALLSPGLRNNPDEEFRYLVRNITAGQWQLVNAEEGDSSPSWATKSFTQKRVSPWTGDVISPISRSRRPSLINWMPLRKQAITTMGQLDPLPCRTRSWIGNFPRTTSQSKTTPTSGPDEPVQLGTSVEWLDPTPFKMKTDCAEDSHLCTVARYPWCNDRSHGAATNRRDKVGRKYDRPLLRISLPANEEDRFSENLESVRLSLLN
ncbi:uncharacterized protein EI97DRAFT_439156 [Westerdykella ornata]|uniref:Uncharacterized protein n=1 Tax=Westerdykella ornata TaxID=318751 RepID=A0A6A6JV18_WESOR|nr:uncharacterized protein EI97DRAFT_439156 [Westerdykella ornata]KAF2280085.1 hypothetical protein EI97DRAFT_439156 [Westerdykella ornata]